MLVVRDVEFDLVDDDDEDDDDDVAVAADDDGDVNVELVFEAVGLDTIEPVRFFITDTPPVVIGVVNPVADILSWLLARPIREGGGAAFPDILQKKMNWLRME